MVAASLLVMDLRLIRWHGLALAECTVMVRLFDERAELLAAVERQTLIDLLLSVLEVEPVDLLARQLEVAVA